MTRRETGDFETEGLALRLAAFLVVGGSAALVLWYAMHQLLAATPVGVPLWLVAVGAVVFVGLVLLLRRKTSVAMPEEGVPEEEQAPVGTLFVLMIYIMVLAGMWGTMYWILLES